VEHVGSDMFKGIPAADAIFLKFKDFIVCLNCARVEHVGSNMFEAIPAADAVFLKFKDFFACLNCAGVEHVGGDMFEAIPAADAVFLKCILHDWDDKKSLPLLRKCHVAIPDGGELMPLKLSLDMALVLAVPGVRERSEEEFKALFDQAGFKSYSIINLPFFLSLNYQKPKPALLSLYPP
ncbi:hypothetical protein KI387_008486, partial [Taxus chinensis]